MGAKNASYSIYYNTSGFKVKFSLVVYMFFDGFLLFISLMDLKFDEIGLPKLQPYPEFLKAEVEKLCSDIRLLTVQLLHTWDNCVCFFDSRTRPVLFPAFLLFFSNAKQSLPPPVSFLTQGRQIDVTSLRRAL